MSVMTTFSGWNLSHVYLKIFIRNSIFQIEPQKLYCLIFNIIHTFQSNVHEKRNNNYLEGKNIGNSLKME